MNLCRPDNTKSCAACCGLYNIPDATKPSLIRKLEARTALFRQTHRSADAIQEYQTIIQSKEAVVPLDPIIHVCEFTGFLDADHRVVGCQLHPSSVGNNGIDWRGLCHYGSMACKAFFCPSWEELPPRYRDLTIGAVHDWHVYGLVITDVEYVSAVFGLLEAALGMPIPDDVKNRGSALQVIEKMLSWKDSPPFAGSSTFRRNRYYCKQSAWLSTPMIDDFLSRLLDCLGFTFCLEITRSAAEDIVLQTVEDFAKAYHFVK